MKKLPKIALPKVHLSKKVAIIAVGVLLIVGASGGAALYFFKDKVMGDEVAKAVDPNGLACLDVQTEVIHKVDRYWIRKYISVDASDGPDRARTAMRVALAIQDKEKPDLVQVVILDGKGPKKRADLRGRAVGANVLLISNPANLPKDMPSAAYSARFIDGSAGPDGLFYGQKVDMTEEDVKALAASISNRDLCGDLTGGAKTDGHGEATSGHGEPAAEGHGEPVAEGHGEAPAEGHDAPAEGEHDKPAADAGHGQPVAEEHASAETPPAH